MSEDWPQSLGLKGITLESIVFSNVRGVSRIWFLDQSLDNGQERKAAMKYCDWVGNTIACFVLLSQQDFWLRPVFLKPKMWKTSRSSSADSIKRKLLVMVSICQGQRIKWVPWIWGNLVNIACCRKVEPYRNDRVWALKTGHHPGQHPSPTYLLHLLPQPVLFLLVRIRFHVAGPFFLSSSERWNCP